MNKHDLLDIIGEAQDQHILSALRTRRENSLSIPKYKNTSLSRKIWLAAALIMLLLLTACAAKYVTDLFVAYFQEERSQEISDSQAQYIQSNTQPSIAQPVATEAEDGYSVTVRSALTDGKVAYITMDITVPEEISLDGGNVRFHENPLLIPLQTEGLVIAPDGSSPDAMCDYSTLEDGDGLSNTASIMFFVNPSKEEDALNPFDGSIHWTLKAGSFYKSTFDNDTMRFTDEELGDGVWVFDLNFQKIETREVSFLAEPMAYLTSYWPADEFVNENQILSFRLSGLSWHMVLAKPEIDGEIQNIGDTSIVMKDGSRQTLLRLTSNDSASLNAPIVLDDVDYVELHDGTKLYSLE